MKGRKEGNKEDWADTLRVLVIFSLLFSVFLICLPREKEPLFTQDDIRIPKQIRGDIQFRKILNIINQTNLYFVNTTRTQAYCGENTSGCFRKNIQKEGKITNLIVIDNNPSYSGDLRWRTIHELAHHIWYFEMNSYQRNAYTELVNYSCHPPITPYATTSVEEDFAENFAAYYNMGIGRAGDGEQTGHNTNYMSWLMPQIGLESLFPVFSETCETNENKPPIFEKLSMEVI